MREWIRKLEEKIENYDVITFDIFDTLIKRDCARPTDIFDIVSENYERQYNDRIDFRTKRFEAEKRFYQKSIDSTPTLKEIYEELDIDEEKKDILYGLELDVEYQYACPNAPIQSIYKKCKEQGKSVYAITDMYLPKEQLVLMLKKCGYEVIDIFVSCEERANKRSGELFNSFLKKTVIFNDDMLHIGDNYKSDILGASKCHIQSFLIPSQITNTCYYKISKDRKVTWEDRFLYPYINNHVALLNDRKSQIGFETFGPMVYGFCQWIHNMKIKYSIGKLLFCARDVYQTMQIYKELYPEDKDCVEYLCVSLKSLKAPYEAVIGKDSSDYANEQLKLIRIYLKQLGCKGKIAMVDSGFGGHTQSMLTAILDDTCELHGLYMRMSKKFHSNVVDKESFPYMFQKKPSAKAYISGGFFETLLSAPHGRTLGYKYSKNGCVEPVFGEKNPCAEILEEFQRGISCFVTEWNYHEHNYHDISSDEIQNAFLNLAFFPERADIDELMNITGGNDKYESIILQSNIKGMARIRELLFGLRDTYWKGGYLGKNFKQYKFISKIYLLIDEFILNIVGF